MLPHRARVSALGGLAIAGLAAGCSAPVERTAESRRAITNGTDDPGDPGVVVVQAFVPRSEGGTGGGFRGTGTVVSPHVVVTAAHVLAPLAMTRGAAYNVIFGTPLVAPSYTIASVREVHLHPGFNLSDPASGHDIAVVILDAPAAVPPVPLNRGAIDASWVGQPIRFVGYGVTSSDDISGSTATARRQGYSTVSGYDPLFLDASPTGTLPCAGDSGGPALVLVDHVETLAGVVSFGDAACSVIDLTRVDTHLDFVDRWVAAAEAPDDAGGAAADGDDGPPGDPGASSDGAVATRDPPPGGDDAAPGPAAETRPPASGCTAARRRRATGGHGGALFALAGIAAAAAIRRRGRSRPSSRHEASS
ncbi:MAG: S1 family peptidase [Myxococcales bacterium]|nr:S1 family peptidase [Myxococcales bacterium]